MPYKDKTERNAYDKQRKRLAREKKYCIYDGTPFPDNYINKKKPINPTITLTDELFDKFDLLMMYNGNINPSIDSLYDKNVVYVIKTKDHYYIGSTIHIKHRLQEHIRSNTNNIRDGGSMYILETVDNDIDMRKMENIWILWFWNNSQCINKLLLGCNDISPIDNTKYKLLIYNKA